MPVHVSERARGVPRAHPRDVEQGADYRAYLAGPVPAQGGPRPDSERASGPQPSVGVAQSSASALVDGPWLQSRLGAEKLVVVDCTVVHQPLPTGGVTLRSGRSGAATRRGR